MIQIAVQITAPISTTNITGLRTWTRGSSLTRLSITARRAISPLNSDAARRPVGVGGAAGVAVAVMRFLC